MVPMADNYNHSHKAVEYYVISRKKILNQATVKNHKEKNMMMNDYSFLFKKELADFDQQQDQALAILQEGNIRGRFDREKYSKNLDGLSHESIRK